MSGKPETASHAAKLKKPVPETQPSVPAAALGMLGDRLLQQYKAIPKFNKYDCARSTLATHAAHSFGIRFVDHDRSWTMDGAALSMLLGSPSEMKDDGHSLFERVAQFHEGIEAWQKQHNTVSTSQEVRVLRAELKHDLKKITDDVIFACGATPPKVQGRF